MEGGVTHCRGSADSEGRGGGWAGGVHASRIKEVFPADSGARYQEEGVVSGKGVIIFVPTPRCRRGIESTAKNSFRGQCRGGGTFYHSERC
ncbi:hypothetical protein CEXT_51561 [Caerostris extrusa]|uniref:Uncharacterized protein n=1 Tax=Caerostris extrusa TaxID=172846 RepID=A0AAV4N7X9_CAEEX|nr:hypothetical protein CEXT_51561 [Caerostris extrusa]